LRKKLFRQVAAASARRPVHRDLSILHHHSLRGWFIASRPRGAVRPRPSPRA
jgi:hypothetical protein